MLKFPDRVFKIAGSVATNHQAWLYFVVERQTGQPPLTMGDVIAAMDQNFEEGEFVKTLEIDEIYDVNGSLIQDKD